MVKDLGLAGYGLTTGSLVREWPWATDGALDFSVWSESPAVFGQVGSIWDTKFLISHKNQAASIEFPNTVAVWLHVGKSKPGCDDGVAGHVLC